MQNFGSLIEMGSIVSVSHTSQTSIIESENENSNSNRDANQDSRKQSSDSLFQMIKINGNQSQQQQQNGEQGKINSASQKIDLKDVINQVGSLVEDHEKKMKSFNPQTHSNHELDYCSESDSLDENDLDKSNGFIIEEYIQQQKQFVQSTQQKLPSSQFLQTQKTSNKGLEYEQFYQQTQRSIENEPKSTEEQEEEEKVSYSLLIRGSGDSNGQKQS
ncbi:UNKNOWN [Stylonychia lemnae]|uniref:Uncharacterized protein n=1 Tax=Stylonychia lemnae TaxID=5949 RepID=A0A077ZT55_STYLE|nr:UNKNOWN [Stylonychia lemnae]|eukprot:CDW73067.1 UNKNOWN [Stylonychia lemnae]